MNDVYYFKLKNTWYERKKKTMRNVIEDKFLIDFVPSSDIPYLIISHKTSRLSNYVISTLVTTTSESFDMEMRYQTHKVLLSSSLFSGLALYLLMLKIQEYCN